MVAAARRVVPSAADLVDIVLSRTQRQTPTVIHKEYAISRIRQFYMRKIKFTEETLHEKLGCILDEFPRIDDMHPFHADLLNVFYDRDHYKLALGEVKAADREITAVGKRYLNLLKYGTSLYSCKMLKRAALGRMASRVKKMNSSLGYLEQVRQHMSRLPSIDPNTRTIVVCGFPNVGKSSFVNKVTRANVDVQPYPFTTKSLFVGHTDYKYLRYQVIDTPGILDHPLEDRNTIEMLSITALAHLRAAMLFFVDLSGSCGYSIREQAKLFDSLKPLFQNKPLLVVCSKIDLQPLQGLEEEERRLIQDMCPAGEPVLTMSTMTDEGVTAVKNAACEKLLQQRVEVKMRSKRVAERRNRLHVAFPRARDDRERPPCIPAGVLLDRALQPSKRLEKDLENENGGSGVYSASLRKNYLLSDAEWREDVVPEIVNGHNVADFVQPDLAAKLEEALNTSSMEEEDEYEENAGLTEEELLALTAIRLARRKCIGEHRLKKSTAARRPVVPRKFDSHHKFTASRMTEQLSSLGIDASAAVKRAGSRSRGTKRSREHGAVEDMEMDAKRSRLTTTAEEELLPGKGFKDLEQKRKALKLSRQAGKVRNKHGKQGEADRTVVNLKPRHLFSGKRSLGKAQRR